MHYYSLGVVSIALWDIFCNFAPGKSISAGKPIGHRRFRGARDLGLQSSVSGEVCTVGKHSIAAFQRRKDQQTRMSPSKVLDISWYDVIFALWYDAQNFLVRWKVRSYLSYHKKKSMEHEKLTNFRPRRGVVGGLYLPRRYKDGCGGVLYLHGSRWSGGKGKHD